MSNTMRAIAAPIIARSTRCCGVGADRRADVEHDRFAAQRRPHRGDRRPLDAAAACAGRTSPSPSARRCCRPRRRNRPRPSSPPRSPATSTTTRRPARSAWLGLSVILIATSVWTTCDSRGERRDARREAARSRFSSPNRMKRMSGRRSSAIAAASARRRRPVVAAHRVERYANAFFHPKLNPEGAP